MSFAVIKVIALVVVHVLGLTQMERQNLALVLQETVCALDPRLVQTLHNVPGASDVFYYQAGRKHVRLVELKFHRYHLWTRIRRRVGACGQVDTMGTDAQFFTSHARKDAVVRSWMETAGVHARLRHETVFAISLVIRYLGAPLPVNVLLGNSVQLFQTVRCAFHATVSKSIIPIAPLTIPEHVTLRHVTLKTPDPEGSLLRSSDHRLRHRNSATQLS